MSKKLEVGELIERVVDAENNKRADGRIGYTTHVTLIREFDKNMHTNPHKSGGFLDCQPIRYFGYRTPKNYFITEYACACNFKRMERPTIKEKEKTKEEIKNKEFEDVRN